MTKSGEHVSHPPQRVPSPPPAASTSAADGLERAREIARRYLPNGVRLWAAVAFAQDSEASLWTRVQCARLLAQVAGALPQAVPEAPGLHDEDGGGEPS
jgi:hypothetical protein